MINLNGKKIISVVKTVTVANYDDLINRPIINADLDATSASTAKQDQLYRHNGASATNYKIGMLYFSNGTSWVAIYNDLETIKKTIYPVNSIYMSVDSTSPASLFGGTWEQIAQGRALFGAGTLNDIEYVAGTTKEAGLPNITGYVKNTVGENATPQAEGALSSTVTSSQAYCGGNGKQFRTISLDASLSNSIYGNSDTVQPNAYVVNVWKRVA